MTISLIATLLKRLGAVCLAFLIFWHASHHASPWRGKAIVHVSEVGHVLVAVDQKLYRVDSLADAPVICDLEPGPHVAQVWLRGVLRGEEHFTIEPGKEVVIAPFDHPAIEGAPNSDRPEPAAQMAPGAGLAVRIPPGRVRGVAN